MPDVYSKNIDRNDSALRDLLNAALSDETLTAFCFDHFRTVYDKFSTGSALHASGQP